MSTLMNSDELNRIISAVDAKTSVFKNCGLFNENVMEIHLSHLEHIKRESASLTDLVSAEIEPYGNKVFLKMWFSWNNLIVDDVIFKTDFVKKSVIEMFRTGHNSPDMGSAGKFLSDIFDFTTSTSLNYEANVYEYITKNIILRNISPNFIPILVKNKCSIPNILESLTAHTPFPEKEVLIRKLQSLTRFFPKLELNFIMTGSAGRMNSFYNMFNTLSIQDIPTNCSVIFQYLYALYVMGEYKIQHNDNHSGNVMVQRLDSPVTLDITIGSFRVKFTTWFIVKFFDWDRAYVEGLGRNDICDTPGMMSQRRINKFIPNRDFYLFLCASDEVDDTFRKALKTMIDYDVPEQYPRIGGEGVLINAVTQPLLDWMRDNPENVSSMGDGTYINIQTSQLETLVTPQTRLSIVTKFGVDVDRIQTVYFKVIGSNIYLTKGFYCHPLIDLVDINIKRLFEDPVLFNRMVSSLPIYSPPFYVTVPILTYQFIPPSLEILTPPVSIARINTDIVVKPFENTVFKLPEFINIEETVKQHKERMRHLVNYVQGCFSTIGNWTQIPGMIQYISNSLSGMISFNDFLTLLSVFIMSSIKFVPGNILNFGLSVLRWIMKNVSIGMQKFMGVFRFLYELVPSPDQFGDAFQNIFGATAVATNAVMRKISASGNRMLQYITDLMERSKRSAVHLFGNDYDMEDDEDSKSGDVSKRSRYNV